MDIIDDKYKKEFGDDYIKELISALKSAGKGSGNLVRSLSYKLVDSGKAISVIIEAEDYLEYVDAGRRPGSFPNIGAIQRWASKKGIPKSAVFPIAKSIYKFGIKPTNVIDDSLSKFEKKGVDIIETAGMEKMEEFVVDELNKIKDIE